VAAVCEVSNLGPILTATDLNYERTGYSAVPSVAVRPVCLQSLGLALESSACSEWSGDMARRNDSAGVALSSARSFALFSLVL